MEYRKFKDLEISSLGMGCMRLPLDKEGEVDVEEAVKTIRYGIDHGINYVDTAYMYHNGFSERVLGKALEDGYREKVFIADKMPPWFAKTEEDLDKIFNKQLSRLGVDYIDMYLIHNVNKACWRKVQKLNVLDFLTKKKEEGKIGYVGFSFHDDYELFEEVLNSYPWDLCQIQFNYVDEDYQAGMKGLKLAGSKGIPVVVMEPLKGGRLASNLPPHIEPFWKKMSEDRTPVDWAFRWVATNPEVLCVLSGMSSFAQMEDNLNLFGTISTGCLKEEDKHVLHMIADTFHNLVEYDCTGCRYCMPCPQGIDIPKSIAMYNQLALYDKADAIYTEYSWMAPKTASVCIECHACEGHCPQQLPITEVMKKCVKAFGN